MSKMVQLIFNESGSLTGYSKTGSITSEEEQIKEVSEAELSKIVSDREEDWESLVSGFYLENDSIKFDGNYSPSQSGGE